MVSEGKALEKVHDGMRTYFFGRFGAFDVGHVQCEMGSISAGGSILTVSRAIDRLKPLAVIMVGIAFGVNNKKQKIGDVLVAKKSIAYEPTRVGEFESLHRGSYAECGLVLLDRFSNYNGWMYMLDDSKESRVFVGDVLSGEKLIDNLGYRNALLKEFATAIGGEMEGCGVAAACREQNVEWILVKGVCDWADGKKSKQKERRQRIAASAAVDLCKFILGNSSCLEGLKKTLQRREGEVKQQLKSVEVDDLFFSVYEERLRRWYLLREVDSKIKNNIHEKFIWLWGESGCGKTSALLKAGKDSFRNVIFIDLSSTLGADLGVILEDVFWALVEEKKIVRSELPSLGDKSPQNILRAIYQVLVNWNFDNSLIIIDEFSAVSGEAQIQFLQSIANLLIKFSNNGGSKSCRLAVGSIKSPLTSNGQNKLKLHERINIIPMSKWTDKEIYEWLNLASSGAGWLKDNAFQSQLVKAAKGCPRKMKLLCRLHSRHSNSLNWTLEQTIKTYSDELAE